MNATEREIAADVTLNGRLLLAQEKTFSISYAPWYGRRRAFKAVTTPYPQKITFGEMRASGVRDVLIYCRDHRCSHYIESGRSFRRPNGDRLKRARWCIKSVHASASRLFGNERDR